MEARIRKIIWIEIIAEKTFLGSYQIHSIASCAVENSKQIEKISLNCFSKPSATIKSSGADFVSKI
jgi:hypothetical protein